MKWSMAMALGLLISGCASTPVEKEAPAAGDVATVLNYGSIMRPRCENADMQQLANGNKEAVCRTYIESIDGKMVTRLKNETSIPLGKHLITLRCNYAIITPADRGAVPQSQTSVNYEADFQRAGKYYVIGEMKNDRCLAYISHDPPPPPAPLWKAFLP